MSSGSSLWRLYPKRSITSHRFCGSGRLFRRFSDGKREAGSDMIWLLTVLVVGTTRAIPDAGKHISAPFRCQEEYCKMGNKVKTVCKMGWILSLTQVVRLQIMHIWTLSPQTRF